MGKGLSPLHLLSRTLEVGRLSATLEGPDFGNKVSRLAITCKIEKMSRSLPPGRSWRSINATRCKPQSAPYGNRLRKLLRGRSSPYVAKHIFRLVVYDLKRTHTYQLLPKQEIWTSRVIVIQNCDLIDSQPILHVPALHRLFDIQPLH